MEINKNQIITRNQQVISSKLDEELVLLSIENGEYYGFNAVAVRIWELIEKPLTLHQLIIQLLSEFDIDERTCELETIQFLNTLAEKKLIDFQ
jgi:hypothetical protein